LRRGPQREEDTKKTGGVPKNDVKKRAEVLGKSSASHDIEILFSEAMVYSSF
jgi:hypothetical protein